MKIGYLILAHKNPTQLCRLVDRINIEGSVIYIHIDKKVDISDFINTIKDKEKVHFVNNRISANWGAFSLVEATLNGLKEMLSKYNDIEYISLLSGQDYPIKKSNYIVNFFKERKGKEFIHFDPFPTRELINGGMDRIEYYYDYDNEVMKKNQYEIEMKLMGIKRDFIENMRPYHGSQWWSLTRECVEYVLDHIDKNKEITNFYRYTRFPDEQIFQTIIMNSKFSSKVVNNNLRYIDWSTVDRAKLDWLRNPPHPKVLLISDYNSLLRSRCLYARKFDENVDSEIIDKIDSFLLEQFLVNNSHTIAIN